MFNPIFRGLAFLLLTAPSNVMAIVEVCMHVSQPLNVDRTVPVVVAVALHGILLYGLAVGLHVVPGPTLFKKDLTLIDVPAVKKQEPERVRELPLQNQPTITPRDNFWVPPPDDFVIDTKPDDVIPPTGDVGPIVVEAPQTIAPRIAKSFEPPYPNIDRLQGNEGVVQVRVTISPYGEVGEATIEKSSGHARLDEAALKAVRQWKFTPARRGEQAIAGSTVVAVRFQLR